MRRVLTTSRGLRPLRFTRRVIRAVIPPGIRGAYGLCVAGADLAPQCIYVGRSDNDLRRRLLRHPHRHATPFVFEPTATAEHAYRAECRACRPFRPPLNRITPARPGGQ